MLKGKYILISQTISNSEVFGVSVAPCIEGIYDSEAEAHAKIADVIDVARKFARIHNISYHILDGLSGFPLHTQYLHKEKEPEFSVETAFFELA